MKCIPFTLCFLALMLLGSCNPSGPEYGVEPIETTEAGLDWYRVEDLEKMTNIEDRKILVDVYTNWCTWCKKMDQGAFTDPDVVAYLNKNYILVKLNAEQKEAINFQGETYESVKAGRRKTNKLAIKFLDGKIGYPTIVYLEGKSLEKIKSSPGYKNAENLLKELQTIIPIPS